MDDMVLFKIYESLNNGESAALGVITEEIGSSPRKSGSIMAIFKNGNSHGSVGGGNLEFTIIKRAIECLEKKEDCNFEYQLTEEDLGMQCGGKVKGYIKVFYPRTKLIIVGAGHIGEKLHQLARVLGFYTVVIDDREDYANQKKFKDADEIIVSNIGEALENYKIGKNDYIVIVTRGHASDKDALKAVVLKKPAYIGMIGSLKKSRFIMKELITEGIPIEALKTVHAPIGLNLASNLPEEIALGILSEILIIKNKGTLNHMKDLKKVWD